MEQLARVPDLSLTDAVAMLCKHFEGDIVAEGAKALEYASDHAHRGKVNDVTGKVLTRDDIAVLHMYTMEMKSMTTNFCGKMNQELGGYGTGKTHDAVDDFLPITKLLKAAFAKLPPLAVTLFRGVKMKYMDMLKTPEGECAKVGDVVQ